MNKYKLDVIGKQFILNSQIDTITDQTAKLYDEKSEFEVRIKKELYDTDKKGKDTGKLKLAFEAECRAYELQDRKESEENYSFKMTLDKGTATGTLSKDRYERDLKLIDGLKTDKTTEKEKVVSDRAAVQ